MKSNWWVPGTGGKCYDSNVAGLSDLRSSWYQWGVGGVPLVPTLPYNL